MKSIKNLHRGTECSELGEAKSRETQRFTEILISSLCAIMYIRNENIMKGFVQIYYA